MPLDLDFYVNEFTGILDQKYTKVIEGGYEAEYTNEQVDKDLEIWLDLYKMDVDLSKFGYVEELRNDIVFGNDSWSAKERFEKQKNQIACCQMAKMAVECAQEALYCIDVKLESLKKQKQVTTTYFNNDMAAYCKTNSEAFAKEEMKNELKKYNFRGFGKYTANFAAGMACFGIFLFLAFIFFLVWIINRDGSSFDRNMGTVFGIMAIVSIVVSIVGFIIAIPAMKLKSEQTETHNKYRNLIKTTSYRISQALQPVLKESQRYFDDNFSFAEKLDSDTITAILDAMRNGLVDSYSSALRYVREEQKKAKERAEDLALKEKEIRMHAEHNAKMENIAQAQLESQYRTEEAMRRQAMAAETAAYYSRQAAASAAASAEYNKQQAKYAKQAAKSTENLEYEAKYGQGIKTK